VSLSPGLLARFRLAAGEGGFVDDESVRAAYESDFRKLYRGRAAAVLRPATVGAVQEIVALAASERVALVPHGGNTSYCGGATPDESGREVVVSLARLNAVREVDPVGNTLTVDAGCLLATAQAAAAGAGRLLALSLGSGGSCQIGGNLSTNAGGTSVLRYGMMREQVLGLEVVLPDGRLLDQLRGLRKDNTGYDVKQWFIGAEGTLGIITGACLKLHPLPRAPLTAVAAVAGIDAAVTLLGRVREEFGDSVTAFEFMPHTAVALAIRHVPGARLPLTTTAPAYVLIEIDDADDDRGHSRLAEVTSGLTEAAIAGSSSQAQAMWFLREHIPEAQSREGASLKHDVSLPVARLAEFVACAEPQLAALLPGARLVAYGHVGDGNLHFNLSPAPGTDGQALLAAGNDVRRLVHDLVRDFGGSFSAEHGIGRLKVGELERYEDPVALDLMRRLKDCLDPNGIMNPGKVLG
jgi:FAD/FMN-containing dehydrogenase